MKSLLLNGFYDAVQYNIGWVITYTAVILMAIQLVYVMVKYLGGNNKK